MKATPELLAIYRQCAARPEGKSEIAGLEEASEIYGIDLSDERAIRRKLAADLADYAAAGEFHDLAALMAGEIDSRWKPFSEAADLQMEIEAVESDPGLGNTPADHDSD